MTAQARPPPGSSPPAASPHWPAKQPRRRGRPSTTGGCTLPLARELVLALHGFDNPRGLSLRRKLKGAAIAFSLEPPARQRSAILAGAAVQLQQLSRVSSTSLPWCYFFSPPSSFTPFAHLEPCLQNLGSKLPVQILVQGFLNTFILFKVIFRTHNG